MYRTEEDHTQEQQLHFLQQTMQNMQQVIQVHVLCPDRRFAAEVTL